MTPTDHARALLTRNPSATLADLMAEADCDYVAAWDAIVALRREGWRPGPVFVPHDELVRRMERRAQR